jgi:hypothetical protein
MTGYEGKHRRHADPGELAKVSSGLAGLANWIEVVPSKSDDSE